MPRRVRPNPPNPLWIRPWPGGEVIAKWSTSNVRWLSVQSNLNHLNPFGQLQNLSVRISKKVQIIEGDVQLTTPTPISYSVYHRLTDLMLHPILAENNSSLTLYTTFLNTILALLNCRSHKHSEWWLHCTLLCMHISISYLIFVLWPAPLLGSKFR